jgi:3-dehydroquinate dehydratase
MKDFISNLPGCPAEILTQLLVVSEEGEDKALLQKAKCIKLVLTYRDWENGDSEKREDERFAVYQQILNLSSLLEGLPIDHSS